MTSAWSELGERRRDALASYGVRGDEPDAGFDALVALAAETCAVPAAAVTLMDETRQWYKARRGFDAISIEIESSLCVHALDSGADVTVIPDTVADPRVGTSPFVTEFGVRTYAGAPLVAPDGLVLGTVCVFDLRPRELTETQLAALQAIARLAVELLEARRNVTRIAAVAEEREEALRQAAANETSFSAVFNNAAVGVLLISLDGRIARANGAFAAMLGHDPDDLQGTSFVSITDPGDVAEDVAIAAPLLAGETSSVVREKRYLHRDGSMVTAVSSTTAILGRDNRVTGLLSTVESIEERRRAEQSLMETQSATDAIITADHAGRVVAWNDGAERMFGHPRRKVLGQPVAVIVPEEFRADHRDGLARVAAGGGPTMIGRNVELTAQRRDGSQFPVELALSTWTFDGSPRFTAVVRDVTERHLLHEELVRQANSDELTGVGNRKWVTEAISAALQDPQHTPLSV